MSLRPLSPHRYKLETADQGFILRADSSTQQTIDSAVLNGFEGSTVLCVTHRLEMLLRFDRVIIMDKGKIIELGNPATLLEKSDSVFARTFNKASLQISTLSRS